MQKQHLFEAFKNNMKKISLYSLYQLVDLILFKECLVIFFQCN